MGLSINLFAQNCPKPNISKELDIKINLDSIYKQDVHYRIEYYAELSNRILPKYFGLKNLIRQELEIVDKEKVKRLVKSHENNRKEYLNEFKQNQLSKYHDALGYSNLNTLLIFETLSLFPDSYAMLVNKTIPNSKANTKDEILINQLYSKYKYILTRNSECIKDMVIDIKNSKNEFKIAEIFQNAGNRTIEDNDKTKLINLLIWAGK